MENKIEMKDEGYNEEGQLIGPVFVNDEPLLDGVWFNLGELKKIVKAQFNNAPIEIV